MDQSPFSQQHRQAHRPLNVAELDRLGATRGVRRGPKWQRVGRSADGRLLTVPLCAGPHVHRRPTAELRYVRDALAAADVLVHHGIPVTSPCRTAFDVTRWSGGLTEARARLVERVREARRRGLSRDRRMDRWTLTVPDWALDPYESLTDEDKDALFGFT